MRCPKCGTENIDGSKFCQECGAKLEQKCPKCGTSLPLTVKFCPECGTSLIKGKTNSSSIVGDKNVIGGDVIGSKEDYNIAGNATFIKNEDETKRVNVCSICGKHIKNTESFTCNVCKQIVCKDCFSISDKKCLICNAKDIFDSSEKILEHYSSTKELWEQSNKLKKVVSLLGKDAEILFDRFKEKISYTIGDIGPAGGFVFYDKGNYSDGWRYLEAAPCDIVHNGINIFQFGNCIDDSLYVYVNNSRNYEEGSSDAKDGKCTGLQIGTGKANTEKLLRKMNKRESISGNSVMFLVDKYSINGYDDWFLPSINELEEMYNNLYLQGIGDFHDSTKENLYWSSSEVNFEALDVGMWAYSFLDSEYTAPVPFDMDLFIRCVRAF